MADTIHENKSMIMNPKVRASRTHMLLCECWGEGLIVWEVAQCHKKTLTLRRAKEEVTGWEVSEPPLIDVSWSNEGQLYAIDPNANLYSVLSDGIGMVTNLEWSEGLEGPNKACFCTFGCGFLIYGPDKLIRSLKKVDHTWKVVWSYEPLDIVTCLVGNATCDTAAAWTQIGLGYRLTGESEEKIEVKLLTFKQRNITKIQLIAPEYKYIATINDTGVVCIYNAWNANLVSIKYIKGEDISFEASPVDPLLAVYGLMGSNYGLMLALLEDGGADEIGETDGTDEAADGSESHPRKIKSEAIPVEPQLRKITAMCLTHQIVSHVVFSPTGREIVAGAMSAGHIFIMRLSKDYKLTLVRYTELGRGLADCFLMKVESQLLVTHRYEQGIKQAVIDTENEYMVHLAGNKTVACVFLHSDDACLTHEPQHTIRPELFEEDSRTMTIIDGNEKNYLDLQEDKKVREEAMDYKSTREEVLRTFESVRKRLVLLLEENIAERPLHQLSLSEFNLHHEHRKERLKQAEREREELRLQTEARIRAQDKVTAWIKATCWDIMLTQRVKLFAIFSHYQVENYPVLPNQRDQWPELQSTLALRGVEMDNDNDLFRPWEEHTTSSTEAVVPGSHPRLASMESKISMRSPRRSVVSEGEVEAGEAGNPYVLSGSDAHRYISVPSVMLQQMQAYSFLHMTSLQHIIKLNVQNMRLWFNKQFDDLMNQKKREVGLVEERNNRLRFIIEELNKLSDLRGSFHHLTIKIRDPEWRQEEQPHRLIKVDPEEVTYIFGLKLSKATSKFYSLVLRDLLINKINSYQNSNPLFLLCFVPLY
ncbi:unnamed protein product [Diatraea saccharalis]|uniref:Cilia- and flagella-associated protein 43 n=1 Tax=Diatraea saccharalis TaxID=40085 RepID=A0A9N9W672_9NEOP|nr:unnamed protein product [Diatraea saccharalis]